MIQWVILLSLYCYIINHYIDDIKVRSDQASQCSSVPCFHKIWFTGKKDVILVIEIWNNNCKEETRFLLFENSLVWVLKTNFVSLLIQIPEIPLYRICMLFPYNFISILTLILIIAQFHDKFYPFLYGKLQVVLYQS